MSNNKLIIFYSILFCFGFILVIINAYYLYNYQDLVEIKRQDLIARLPFMSNTTGFLFYPLVIIPLSILSFMIKKEIGSFKTAFFMSLIGVVIVGILFYSKLIGNLVYGDITSVLIGLFLIVVSSFMYLYRRVMGENGA